MWVTFWGARNARSSQGTTPCLLTIVHVWKIWAMASLRLWTRLSVQYACERQRLNANSPQHGEACFAGKECEIFLGEDSLFFPSSMYIIFRREPYSIAPLTLLHTMPVCLTISRPMATTRREVVELVLRPKVWPRALANSSNKFIIRIIRNHVWYLQRFVKYAVIIEVLSRPWHVVIPNYPNII